MSDNAPGRSDEIRDTLSKNPLLQIVERNVKLKKNGKGWTGCCPFHFEKTPSFYVYSDGNHADDHYHCYGCSAHGDAIDFLSKQYGLDFASAMERLRGAPLDRKPRSKSGGTILETYDYTTAEGDLVFQVCRKEPKTFVQRRPDASAKDGWVWNTEGILTPLYQLPDVVKGVAAGETIFICEGEKGVNAIRSLGLTATCSPGGAKKWKAHHSTSLLGADVVILPDNDKIGREHAADVTNHLNGVAKSVRTVALPGLVDKADPFDWAEAGGTREQLEALIKEPPQSAPASVPQTEDDDDPEWVKYLQRDDRGIPLYNLANTCLALRQAKEMAGLVAFDDMARQSMLTRTVPKSRTEAVTSCRQIRDGDISAIQEWLQRNKLRKVGRDTVQQSVDLVSSEHHYHPVKDYLTGLRWDKTPRLDTFLSVYFGAEHSEYHARIGRWFLISMVARIMQPGCKADYCVVLEGGQGAKKSTACAILGGSWFSDSLPELNHGDSVRISMHLRGKWLIEIAELSSISKAEAGALKMFLSQTEEKYTPKYGRNEVVEPRQCVFVGTTNKSAYLKDETGGRRFWPVKTGIIEVNKLARDRDQLFAEAMSAFCKNEQWWPDAAFERQHIAPQQEARFDADAWESAIFNWLGSGMSCTVEQVARGALDMQTGRIGTADQRRITSIMERLGWVRGPRGTGGIRKWLPPDPSAAE